MHVHAGVGAALAGVTTVSLVVAMVGGEGEVEAAPATTTMVQEEGTTTSLTGGTSTLSQTGLYIDCETMLSTIVLKIELYSVARRFG